MKKLLNKLSKVVDRILSVKPIAKVRSFFSKIKNTITMKIRKFRKEVVDNSLYISHQFGSNLKGKYSFGFYFLGFLDTLLQGNFSLALSLR